MTVSLRHIVASLILTAEGALLRAAEAPPSATPRHSPILFETHVRPLLKAHCWHCHGEEEEVRGALDARQVRSLAAGGDSGPALVAGDHAASLIYQRVASGEMPPGTKKLAGPEVELLAQWIDQGARTARPEPASPLSDNPFTDEERNHWSFQPLRSPTPPQVGDPSLVRTPIDAFLLAALEARGLSFGPPADRATLMRRVSFDLTGLPPSPSDVEEFIRDASPDAYENLVDRLLASPAYGERWGRHWLDVVGYADSDGYSEKDTPRKWAYRYRDYLIRSLNDDKPWDVFLIEQLAGDELLTPPFVNLTPSQADCLIATGMLRMAPDGTTDGAVDQNVASNDVVAGTIQIASSAVLGLTLACAQCHDHRYDPISQVDYYRFRALFEPAYDWRNWRSSDARLVSLWTDATRQRATAVEAEVQEINRQRTAELDQLVSQVFDRELAKLPAELHASARLAHQTPADKRTDDQQELISQHPFLNVDRSSVYLYLPDRLTDFNKRWDERTQAAQAQMPADDYVHCLTETPGHIPTTHVLSRGNFHSPKQEVAPGELAILNADGLTIAADDPQLPTSGRRLAYARHLTSGRHPLTSRVLANRFWLHHFGRGLAATPADFGLLGEAPSHPDLLDWLADDLVRGGWKLKRWQRTIVTSNAYRQSSRRRDALEAVDPENRLLGRMSVRRLEAETVRDALLSISGQLSSKMFGPPTPIMPDEMGQIVVGVDTRDSAGRPTGKFVPLGEEEFRRSVYVQSRRSKPLGILETFDAPAMTPNCVQRASSTNAPQSLLMMNNAFVLQQAEALARRVEREAGSDPRAQFERAWLLAFGRPPTELQMREGTSFLHEQTALLAAHAPADNASEAARSEGSALTNLCHALTLANGFLYVE